jgi:hypothetical protein
MNIHPKIVFILLGVAFLCFFSLMFHGLGNNTYESPESPGPAAERNARDGMSAERKAHGQIRAPSVQQLAGSMPQPEPIPVGPPKDARQYSIFLDGEIYTSDATIGPRDHLVLTFLHPDKRVTKIRMQHHTDEGLFKFLPVGEPVPIPLHDQYVQMGKVSSSRFIAVDDEGREYGTITLVFQPF